MLQDENSNRLHDMAQGISKHFPQARPKACQLSARRSLLPHPGRPPWRRCLRCSAFPAPPANPGPSVCPVQVPLMSCSALKALMDDPRRTADVTVVDCRLPEEVGHFAADAAPHCLRPNSNCHMACLLSARAADDKCHTPCDPCPSCLCRWRSAASPAASPPPSLRRTRRSCWLRARRKWWCTAR
jgi:hypothetical protein